MKLNELGHEIVAQMILDESVSYFEAFNYYHNRLHNAFNNANPDEDIPSLAIEFYIGQLVDICNTVDVHVADVTVDKIGGGAHEGGWDHLEMKYFIKNKA